MLTNHPDLWCCYWPRKPVTAHKYDHGHTVIYGGGKPMAGAAQLAARAAQRIGSGLVTIACDTETWPVYAASNLSILTRIIDDNAQWQQLLADERVTSIVIGCGAGQGDAVKSGVLLALKTGQPCVIDADALNVFQYTPQQLFEALHENCVLTPHDGEFARLFDTDETRAENLREATTIANCTIVLKGHKTLIDNGDESPLENTNASPWLATAGSGDVLAGLIGGLLAQGVPAKQAAAMAVWCHAEVAQTFSYGMIAEDLVQYPIKKPC